MSTPHNNKHCSRSGDFLQRLKYREVSLCINSLRSPLKPLVSQTNPRRRPPGGVAAGMAHAPFCNTSFLQFLVSRLGTQRNLNQHSQAIFLFKRTSNFKFCYAYAPLPLICTWSPFLLNRHKPTQLNFTASSTVSGSWGKAEIRSMHQDAITTNTVITCHPSHRTWGERRVETGRRKAPESKTTWTGGRWEGMRHSLQLPVLCGYLYQQAHFLTSPDAIYTPAEKLSARQMLGNSTIYRGVYSSYPWRLEASISKSLYKKTRGKTSSESGKELPHPLFWSQLWDLSHFGSHLPFQSKLPFPLPWKQVFIIEAGTGF